MAPELPFEFRPRWSEIMPLLSSNDPLKIAKAQVLLEDKDRWLEEYLMTLGTGATGGAGVNLDLYWTAIQSASITSPTTAYLCAGPFEQGRIYYNPGTVPTEGFHLTFDASTDGGVTQWSFNFSSNTPSTLPVPNSTFGSSDLVGYGIGNYESAPGVGQIFYLPTEVAVGTTVSMPYASSADPCSVAISYNAGILTCTFGGASGDFTVSEAVVLPANAYISISARRHNSDHRTDISNLRLASF